MEIESDNYDIEEEEDIDLDELLEDIEVEEEDEEEEVEEEEEEEVEEEEEEKEIELDIEEEEEKEVELDIEDNEEDGTTTFNDLYGGEEYVNKKQRRVKIQRYCKSSKDIIHRVKNVFIPNEFLITSILSQFTTENNAKKFTKSFNKDELYQLCGKLIKKEFSYAELYKEIETKTDEWSSKTYKNELEKEAQDIQVMTVKLSVTEGLYQCSRCKSKKTYSRQVQTRSADEGMTSIIQCSECNKVWKEYS